MKYCILDGFGPLWNESSAYSLCRPWGDSVMGEILWGGWVVWRPQRVGGMVWPVRSGGGGWWWHRFSCFLTLSIPLFLFLPTILPQFIFF